MKSCISLIILILSSFCLAQEGLIFDIDHIIITDNKNVFYFKFDYNYLYAYDTTTNTEKTITIPSLTDIIDPHVKYASETPDGYIVIAKYTKRGNDNARKSTVNFGAFFYDKNGIYKDTTFDFPDRDFLAVAPWDNENVVLAWSKKAFRSGEWFYVNGLSIVNRKGHLVADLQDQKRYELSDYYWKRKFNWSSHRLYWQENQLIYVDPNSDEVTYFSKDKVILKKWHAKSDLIPGDGHKSLHAYFKVGAMTVLVLNKSDKQLAYGFWADLEQPEIIHSQTSYFKRVHLIGNEYYAFISTTDGHGKLELITESNWHILFQ